MNERGFLKSVFTPAAFGLAAIGAVAGAALGHFGLGSIAFNAAASPIILGSGLASLPILWNLPKSQPAKKGVYYFPAIDILFKLTAMQPKPASMPWWQKCINLGALVAAAVGASDPGIDTVHLDQSRGPVILAVDNGWTSATHWDQAIVPRLNNLIDAAEAKGRPVLLLPSASGANENGAGAQPVDAAHARSMVMALKPQPWPTDHRYQIDAIENLPPDIKESASLVWLSDGLQTQDALKWAQTISQFGLTDILSGYSNDPHLLSLKETSGESMAVQVSRLDTRTDGQATLIFSDDKAPLLQKQALFKAGESQTTLHVDIPSELRGQLTRISIEGEHSAGATLLLDDMWRQRSVGLINTNAIAEPLKDGTHYIQSAIEPFTDLHKGQLTEILQLPVAVIILTDNTLLTGKEREDLTQWIEKGGTLLRFAGPNLAARPDDNLLPVKLRRGEKTVTGDLSGNSSGAIAPFGKSSPFSGISIPEEAKVNTLVLAEPGPDTADVTWASLDNGIPLITAAKKGDGRIVLVHTTANLDWSRIPLSGEFFLKMMRTIVSQSVGTNQAQLSHSLPPLKSLDAQGRLGPAAHAKALTPEDLAAGQIDGAHPPGFYGDDSTRMALNIGSYAQLSPLRDWPSKTRIMPYVQNEEYDYGAIALAASIMLIMGSLGVSVVQNKTPSSKPPAISRRNLLNREARGPNVSN